MTANLSVSRLVRDTLSIPSSAPGLDHDVIRLFEQWVRDRPRSRAVVGPDGDLTFSQLNAAAERLTVRLAARGVTAESRVALCLGRGVRQIVAILAVWKAGGAYVPLDPAYPTARLRMLLDDCRPDVVLTESAHLSRLNTPENILILDDLDGLSCLGDGYTEDRHGATGRAVDPSQLAYIIYTSGSTGTPKGVQVERGSLAHLLRVNQVTLHPALGDRPARAAVTASFSFDASVNQMSWLLRGDSLWIVDDETRRDSAALVTYLRENCIDVLDVTPLQLSVLIPLGLFSAGCGPSLVIVAGEATGPALWNTLREIPDTRFFNLYGPTEGTVYATAEPLTDAAERPSIGRPILNTRAYVVDEEGHRVADGAEGELWIGGPGVARGYWGKPELTAERFLDDPFLPGERTYRTGDLVVRRADGRIEFRGRVDDQVKIRGVRVEPDEVAHLLARHPGVREAAVVARRDRSERLRLIGYVTPADAPAPSAEDVDRTVEQWRSVFQEAHEGPETEDPEFDIRGWASSYTGRPLPAAHMREWVEATVERIRMLRPRRILEIGVGSGLLLWRLAPDCERYAGTDFSANTVDILHRRLQSRPLPGVSVHHAEAVDLTAWRGESFDCVVINSVAQYFPSADHLTTVLRGALELLSPGGHIFVGDVRHVDLLDAFHASVVTERHSGASDLRRKALASRDAENELLLAPGWFDEFAAAHKLAAVRIAPKKAHHDNELTRFRYDVVLAATAPDTDDGAWRDFAAQPLSPAELHSLIARGDRVRLAGIPHATLAPLVRAAHALFTTGTKAGAFAANAAEESSHLTPASLTALAAEHGRPVAVSWRAGHTDGSFDAVIGAEQWEVTFPQTRAGRFGPLANRPRPRGTRSSGPEDLACELTVYVADRLPEHLRPSHIVTVEQLPLTHNGKLDRRALPDPADGSEGGGAPSAASAVPPRTPTEHAVAVLWSESLGVESLGRHDNYFDMGGDSLSAARMLASVRQQFGPQLSLRHLLAAPDLAEFCVVLDDELLSALDESELANLLMEVEENS